MESVFTVNGFSETGFSNDTITLKISWLSEPYNILNDKLQKVMGITECIFSVSRDVFTPFVKLVSYPFC
jgi:hypothetical protein